MHMLKQHVGGARKYLVNQDKFHYFGTEQGKLFLKGLQLRID